MVAYDEFGFLVAPEPAQTPEARLSIREAFPEAGVCYVGGVSDGWEYRTVFAGSNLGHSYAMVRQFLQEEGYGDIPLPATPADLSLFRRSKRRQLCLFDELGYIHNPVKILFSPDARQRSTLILCIYNERAPDHLLRFHGVK
jgi:hypothetical protein